MLGDRFNRSWQVAKESFLVLRNNPSLSVFPILSGIAAILVSIPFILILAFSDFKHASHQGTFGTVHYVASAAMYFCNYFAIIFFNSALVACANENLQGRPTSLSFGLHAAARRLPQILGWTLIASTVGLILRTIGERTGVAGAIVTSIIGLAWNIAVFFVVPCMVLDLESPFSAVKKSTGMLKQTWGERIILGVGVGSDLGILYLFAFIPFLVAIFCAVNEVYVLAIIFGIAGVLSLLAVSIIASAITTIYQTALYIYCRTGSAPTAFNPESFQNAFKPKPASGLFGR